MLEYYVLHALIFRQKGTFFFSNKIYDYPISIEIIISFKL